ncbi:kinase-like domain-containing protein [Apodospora peruviana]|uniref:Kinase-like domain-containing protein n=1 Tax=Apodospora peruviana TaxID=516989 RepID=A0AAE0I5W1_9PEZI|nr:kinase-like domain-containing protein [Apodospora peruviana]
MSTSTPDKPNPLPKWLRLRITASILMAGSRRRGPGNVIILPFNKVAKLNVSAGEIAAMEFVRANTTIPIPRILENHDRQPDGTAHIVMTHVPGRDLEDAMADMTTEQVSAVVKELADYLAQLRRLDKDAGEKPPILGGVGGITGHDCSLGWRPWGPFGTVAEFHTYLRFGGGLEDWRDKTEVWAVHSKQEQEGGHYRVKFTHADIAPRNIRVGKDGKITGIIDWEFAGWYPEYWEYVKMAYGGALQRPAWKKWSDALEAEQGIKKYKDELKGMEAIWLRAGPFPYD